MNKIVVIGSINADLVFLSDIRPKAGETVLGNDFKTVPGGKGANQAVAASRLGSNVSMIGCVGNDSNGRFLLDNFNKNSVNIDSVRTKEGIPTGVANIIVAENDNSIIVISGANNEMNKEIIDENKDKILDADIVMLQLEIPLETVKYVIDYCYNNNIKTILNPAPAIKLDEDIIKKSTFLTPNEHECKLILGLDNNVDIVDIIKKYPNKMFITLGEKGVMYYNGTEKIIVPSCKVEVVDTTGAGDTFNGAFASAVSKGSSINDAIKFANKASSKSVTKFGAQGGMPYLNEIS